MSDSKKLRIAVVGCGAVAGAHVPIIGESAHAEVAALADKSVARARDLARTNAIEPVVLEDYRDVADVADAAIVALPHHLHAPVSTALLQSGLHVFVEKPMALTVHECDEMIQTAEESGTVLVVGQLRRYFHSSRFVKSAIDSGLLGEITGFDVREGVVYNWPASSNFTFRKDMGGGVLADQGAHALDVLLWWLGDHKSVDYHDDAVGGVEADCELHLQLKSGAAGIVELSRTRDLRNTVILRGERGTLEIESVFDSRVCLSIDGEDTFLSGRAMRKDEPGEDVTDIFRRQLADFVNAALNRREPFIPGREGRRAVALMEECRASRKPLDLPWRAVSSTEPGT